LQIKTKIVSCHTADSTPVNQEVNCTVILPPLVFPGSGIAPSRVENSVHVLRYSQNFFSVAHNVLKTNIAEIIEKGNNTENLGLTL
jgi:hypothetical protein